MANDQAATVPKPERELLALYGMTPQRLAEFNDGRPVAEDELDPLLRMLVAVRRFTLEEIHDWAQAGLPDAAVLEDTRAARGRIYRVRGVVRRVDVEKLPSELADRFQLERYFRCELASDGGEPLVVFALDVPRAWQTGTRLNEPAGASAMLIKRTGDAKSGSEAKPAFVAQRLEFYPRALLGELGMDVGLLDDVADRKPIEATERACFYNLLAAVKRSPAGELLRQAARHDAVAPLFNEPSQQRGRLVGITGTAIRAVPIVVEDREMRSVYGIESYYEVEVVNADSRGNAMVFCVLELPPGMPTGERIATDVRAAGFYFKSWAYHPHPLANKGLPEGQTKLRLSPLLIGRELALLPKPAVDNSLMNGISVALLVAGMAALVLLAWWFKREDRRYRRAGQSTAEPITLPPDA